MTLTKKSAPATGTHPPVAQMVKAALKDLKNSKGVSLCAIKQYIVSNYKADIGKLAPFIRRYLRKAVAYGILLQVNGTGTSGLFCFNRAHASIPAIQIPQKAETPHRRKSPKAPIPSAPKKVKTPPIPTIRLWGPIQFSL